MADRSVTVRLRADISQFQREMAAARASTEGLGKSTKSTSRDVDGLEKSSSSAGKEIDKLSGRVALFAKAAAAIGPGLIPIAAVGVPAITAMSGALGVGVLALGTTVLAVNGVGDALKALNQAQLEPTAANLEKARQEFDKISPSARQFVLELDQAEPALRSLKEVAGEDLFPGLTAGLDGALTTLPRVRGLLKAVGGAVGNLGEMTGESLASGKWNGFLDFLTTEAPPAIEALGVSTGNLVHGLTELWMAFGPLNSDVLGGLVNATDDFDKWAQGLSQTDGFKEFIAYIRDNADQVGATLGAIGNGLLQIVEAASPLGGPTLKIIETLADAIASIADSPIGTPLIGLVAAMSALSLGTKAFGAARTAAFGPGALTNFKQVSTGLNTIITAQDRATMSAKELAAAQAKQAGVITGGKAIAGQAAQLGLLAVAASGAADGIGLSNTANYALLGSFAGPWGAAIGGGIGLISDYAHANDAAENSLAALKQALNDDASLSGYTAALRQARAETDSLAGSTASYKGALTPTGLRSNLDVLVGGYDSSQLGKVDAAANDLEARLGDLRLGAQLVAVQLGLVGNDGVASMSQLGQALQTVTPAMDALGISTDDIGAAVRDGSITDLVARLGAWQAVADSAAGRTSTLADSLLGLDDTLVSTASSAAAFRTALDQALSPQLDLSQATDQWVASLRSLDNDLAKNGRTLNGNSNAALANRDAIRSRVQSITGLLNAEAASGAGTVQLTRSLGRQRTALIDAGVAAGLSRTEMRNYLDTLGLTPKTVRTIIEAQTGQALAGIDGVQSALNNLKSKTIYIDTINRRSGPGGQTPARNLPGLAAGSTVSNRGPDRRPPSLLTKEPA